MLTVMLDDFASEEFLDDLDRLDQPVQPHGSLWPVRANDVLIQRFARAHAQPEAAGEHLRQRRGRLRQNRGMIAESGRGNTRTEPYTARHGAERAHPRPDESRLPLLRRPRVKMV
jgi:hypothetical protein